jgi:transcriptional regulator of acetoin/glycerol metabolism
LPQGREKMAARHSDVHIIAVEAALSKGEAARSPLVASWSRSAHLHGLDPARKGKSDRLTAAEFTAAREAMGHMLNAATPSLDRLFQAVGGVGCCVMLANRDGIPLERRGARGDDSTFSDWGLWLGTRWSESAQGTNGIGTALVEERVVTIDRNQHFLAHNTILSCMSAPLFDEFGQLAGVLDVSSARSDLTMGISRLIVQALTEAAQRIESDSFRAAFPKARMVLVPNNTRASAALLAVDSDDLVIGATRAARLTLNLPGDIARNPVPAADALAGAQTAAAQPERLEDGERAVLMRALARAQGNASAAARNLGISRATFHRKIGSKET